MLCTRYLLQDCVWFDMLEMWSFSLLVLLIQLAATHSGPEVLSQRLASRWNLWMMMMIHIICFLHVYKCKEIFLFKQGYRTMEQSRPWCCWFQLQVYTWENRIISLLKILVRLILVPLTCHHIIPCTDIVLDVVMLRLSNQRSKSNFFLKIDFLAGVFFRFWLTAILAKTKRCSDKCPAPGTEPRYGHPPQY